MNADRGVFIRRGFGKFLETGPDFEHKLSRRTIFFAAMVHAIYFNSDFKQL
ncbi:MAG: hypothetical protein [Olavius algarvensis Delta 4 endosymbiont]|nr:MAG: hypothetical protein [Olavius algarvensis Delta 4 endosymbiont]